MGKATKKKREEIEAKAQAPLLQLVANNKKPPAVEFDPRSALRAYLDLYAIKPMDQFVSKIKSSKPENLIMEMVRYAFNKYPTPTFLNQVWTTEKITLSTLFFGHKVYVDFRDWYIALASGKSLYKTCTKGLLTKQESHLFATCQFNLTIPEAIWYAVMAAMDIHVFVARKIAQTKINTHNLDEFWKSVARWFAKNETTIRNMNDLLDYIEFHHIQNAEWHLKDHTLETLTKRMHSWHRALGRSKGMNSKYPMWQGINVPDSQIIRGVNENKMVWSFHQIKTGMRLAEEGNKQRHCVSAYARSCFEGTCSIWSLTKWNLAGKGWHALTIQVSQAGTIMQARGVANRKATGEEANVMGEWARACGFSLGTYY